MTNIVSVMTETNSRYSVPAELIEMQGTRALVKFAAGNVRLVGIDTLAVATEQDRAEFESAQKSWVN